MLFHRARCPAWDRGRLSHLGIAGCQRFLELFIGYVGELLPACRLPLADTEIGKFWGSVTRLQIGVAIAFPLSRPPLFAIALSSSPGLRSARSLISQAQSLLSPSAS